MSKSRRKPKSTGPIGKPPDKLVKPGDCGLKTHFVPLKDDPFDAILDLLGFRTRKPLCRPHAATGQEEDYVAAILVPLSSGKVLKVIPRTDEQDERIGVKVIWPGGGPDSATPEEMTEALELIPKAIAKATGNDVIVGGSGHEVPDEQMEDFIRTGRIPKHS